LLGFNATTVEDVFSAIGTIKRNSNTAAAVSSAAFASSVIVAPSIGRYQSSSHSRLLPAAV
jgi:hypothetical protein